MFTPRSGRSDQSWPREPGLSIHKRYARIDSLHGIVPQAGPGTITARLGEEPWRSGNLRDGDFFAGLHHPRHQGIEILSPAAVIGDGHANGEFAVENGALPVFNDQTLQTENGQP